MDRDLLRHLRWAYNYLCLPRESLLIRRLHDEISEQDEPGPLFLDGDEVAVVERALVVCRAFQDLEREASAPLRICDGKGRSAQLLLSDAEIEESLEDSDREDEAP